MKIHISNGNPDVSRVEFERKLDQLEKALVGLGHSVTRATLRDMDLRGCTGCFGCWIKRPGECVQSDDGPVLRQAIIQSDFCLMASPLRMGFPSALLKTSLDKSIPLIHPYLAMVNGEVHHRARYPRYPRMGLLIEEEPGTDELDRHILGDIFSRVALNMKSKLEFVAKIDQPVDELRDLITRPAPKQGIAYDRKLGPTVGKTVPPPTRLTVFNGSPRGQKGNTPLLLLHFLRGFESLPGRSSEIFQLNRTNDRETFRSAFEQAESVLVGFPLYVDSMPGQVKAFIESLEGFVGRPNNPPVGFLVQSGFPEAVHCRHVERYLEKLAARLGSPYYGTMLRGGVEGVQTQNEKMTAPLFDTLYKLGRGFAETGCLDPALLRALVWLEKIPGFMVPLFHLMARASVFDKSWDQDLKRNGVFEERFARPYHQS